MYVVRIESLYGIGTFEGLVDEQQVETKAEAEDIKAKYSPAVFKVTVKEYINGQPKPAS